jgi:hypothetical protein
MRLFTVTVYIEREVIVKACIQEILWSWNRNRLDFRLKYKMCWRSTVRCFTDDSRPQLFIMYKLTLLVEIDAGVTGK